MADKRARLRGKYNSHFMLACSRKLQRHIAAFMRQDLWSTNVHGFAENIIRILCSLVRENCSGTLPHLSILYAKFLLIFVILSAVDIYSRNSR